MCSFLLFLIGTGLDNHFFGTTHVSYAEFPRTSLTEPPRVILPSFLYSGTRSPPVNFGMCPLEAYSAFMFIIQLPHQRNQIGNKVKFVFIFFPVRWKITVTFRDTKTTRYPTEAPKCSACTTVLIGCLGVKAFL